MMRTPFDGAAGVALGSCTYACVLTLHTNVVPSSVGGITLALRPDPTACAAVRSACRRAGASAYGCRAPGGGAIGAAPSSAPAGVDTWAGEPGDVPMAPKLWNTGVV